MNPIHHLTSIYVMNSILGSHFSTIKFNPINSTIVFIKNLSFFSRILNVVFKWVFVFYLILFCLQCTRITRRCGISGSIRCWSQTYGYHGLSFTRVSTGKACTQSFASHNASLVQWTQWNHKRAWTLERKEKNCIPLFYIHLCVGWCLKHHVLLSTSCDFFYNFEY